MFWPVVSSGEEPGEHGGGSSFQGRELSRKRNDIGSQTVGGKAAGLVAGSQKIAPRESECAGALVDGRRSEPGKPVVLTHGR